MHGRSHLSTGAAPSCRRHAAASFPAPGIHAGAGMAVGHPTAGRPLSIAGDRWRARVVKDRAHENPARAHWSKCSSDPSASARRPRPHVAANNVLAFDNLSGVRSWPSDALCRLPSGGSFPIRRVSRDLADPLSQGRLLGSAGTVVIGRAACRNGSAGLADRHPERSTHKVNRLASPSRRHSLRRITSCSISLSTVRSATTRRSRIFSSSAAATSSPRMALTRHRVASSDRRSLPRSPSCGTPRQPLRSALRLLERKRNLLFSEFRFLHRPASLRARD
jgi:hypothetical protein